DGVRGFARRIAFFDGVASVAPTPTLPRKRRREYKNGKEARCLRRVGPSGRFARLALVLGQVVVAGGAQFVRVEVVDRDRVEGQLAQFLQLHALLGGDPALAHALVELRLEVQRLDRAVLERLEELALDRLGGNGRGQVAVDAATHVVL